MVIFSESKFPQTYEPPPPQLKKNILAPVEVEGVFNSAEHFRYGVPQVPFLTFKYLTYIRISIKEINV